MRRTKAMREAYGEALVEVGSVDNNIVVLDADVAHSTRSICFQKGFPDRFWNIGIAEANMVGIAAGMVTVGLTPIVNTFSFLLSLRALDQIRTSVAYPRLNVKFAANYGGMSDSYDGATHHSIMDIAIMRAMPNMTVVVPSDPTEAKLAVKAMVRHEGPVFLRISRAEVPCLYDESHTFCLGKGNVLRDGCDVTIVATGVMVSRSLDAADFLQSQGLSVRVVGIHTIKPLDEELIIRCANETKALVIVEEHSIFGGLGGAVAEVVATKCPVPLEFVGIRDTFAQSGGYEELLDEYGMSAVDIQNAVAKVLKRDPLYNGFE